MPKDLWTGQHYVGLCSCNSGLRAYERKDARDIFLCFACNDCWEEKQKRFRRDVLDDPNYWHDEPIDDE